MELKKIAAIWLKENGYDGLVHPDAECGCQVTDLMPCGCPDEDCRAGHEKQAGPSTGYDFFIIPGKREEQ